MNRNESDYLVPLLLAEGSLPMGRLVYHATGEVIPGGTVPNDVWDELNELCDNGYIRIERHHNTHSRRVEKTVWLTESGRDTCKKVIEASRYIDFAEKEVWSTPKNVYRNRVRKAEQNQADFNPACGAGGR